MVSKINLLGTITLLLCSYIGVAQETTVFSLTQAKDYALEHHNDIKKANYNIEIATLQRKEAIGIGLPQVGLTANFRNFLNLPVQVMDATFLNPMANPGETVTFKAGTEYTAGANLDVNQLIFNGSYIVGLKASKLYSEFSRTLAKQTTEDVLYNVIQAYNLAAIAKENLDYSDSILLSTQILVDKQQHFLELKLIVQEDMDQFKLTLSNAKNSNLNASTQYENSLALLKFSMGYPLDDTIEINQTSEELLKLQSLNSDLDENISMKVMQGNIELQKLNVQNIKAGSLPTLGAFFQQGYNAYRTDFNFFANQPWYPQTVWGIQLNVPIYSGSRGTAKANIELLKLESDGEFMDEALKFQEVQAKNKLKLANSQIKLQLENLNLAKSIYSNAITKEEIGKINSLEVTQKQQQLLIAQSQYIGAMVNLFEARLELDKLYNNILSSQN